MRRNAAADILTVQKQRKLSDQVEVTVTLTVGRSDPRVDWKAPPTRPPDTAGLSALTDAEAYQYGVVLGETYRDFARISGATLMHVTDERCGRGLREGGATEVQLADGAAIAVFVGKVQ